MTACVSVAFPVFQRSAGLLVRGVTVACRFWQRSGGADGRPHDARCTCCPVPTRRSEVRLAGKGGGRLGPRMRLANPGPGGGRERGPSGWAGRGPCHGEANSKGGIRPLSSSSSCVMKDTELAPARRQWLRYATVRLGGGGEGFLPRRGEFEAPIRRAASGSPAPLPEGSPACGNRRCLLAPARLCLLAPARLCLLAPARRQSLRYATLHPPPLLLRLPPSRQSETEGRRLGAGASASPSHPPPAIPLLSRHWSGPPAWHPESWVEGNKEGEAGFQTSLP